MISKIVVSSPAASRQPFLSPGAATAQLVAQCGHLSTDQARPARLLRKMSALNPLISRITLNTFYTYYTVGVRVWMCMSQCTCKRVRQQFAQVDSFLPSCESWASNLGHQTWRPALYHPSHPSGPHLATLI